MGVKSIKYNNCETFKIKNTKIPNHMDKVLQKARESPGVGRYNIATTNRIKGSSKMTEKKGSLQDEIAYRGEQSPCSTKYSMKVPLDKYKLDSVISLKISPPKNGT